MEILTEVYNTAIEQEWLPEDWTVENVTLLHKGK